MVKQCDRNKYMKKYFEIFDSNDQDFEIIDNKNLSCFFPRLFCTHKKPCLIFSICCKTN